jgi:hypothetical protein
LNDIANEELSKEIIRCVIYPRAFNQNAFSEEQYLQFDSDKEFKADEQYKSRYVMSVGMRDKLPLEEDVRAFCCRTVKKSNERLRKNKNTELKPLEEARHYLGFYSCVRENIEAIKCKCHKLIIAQETEEGEEAHGHIAALVLKNSSKNDAKHERVRLVVDIAALLKGPHRQTCDEDSEIAAKLEQIFLPQLPQETFEAQH